ncbi:MAG: UvrB/UvrC motif-containing protein [Phycisphaerae bacterium]|nr:UvrB/UvrC motif-containing protein [Phycisphaerae bacterium]MDW8263163.1 UvrB/UvrC motif-containing protein [Phycisphaerales bacterium]
MSQKNRPADDSEAPLISKDITPVLAGWDYEPGTINVRKIRGNDGVPRLQMRLDLGLLQMEMTGRPDGQRPHGCESLLDYFSGQLEEYKLRNGTELGFHLTGQQCQQLREEAQMYYYRYLSLYVLEDFPGVVRDTERNLRVLDLCSRYAVDEQDRLVLEQYRPYILMMNARASASIFYRENRFKEALALVEEALAQIRQFFSKYGQADAYSYSSEVKVLKRFARQIRKKLPVDPVVKLRSQLDRAVRAEQYEEAARLRDEIKRKTEQRA